MGALISHVHTATQRTPIQKRILVSLYPTTAVTFVKANSQVTEVDHFAQDEFTFICSEILTARVETNHNFMFNVFAFPNIEMPFTGKEKAFKH